MKRIIKLTALFIALISLMYSIGCTDNNSIHNHEYQWFLISAPTVESNGKLEGICSCGKKQTQELSATGTSGGGQGKHEHAYQWFITAYPTCKEKGSLEGICSCGDIKKQELSAKGHAYVNGVCLFCKKEEGAIYIDENEKLGYGVTDFVKYANEYNITKDEQVVKTALKYVSLTDIYINKLGLLKGKVKWGDESTQEVNLLDVRCDFPVETNNNYIVFGINVVYGKLQIVTTDGTTHDMGFITEFAPNTGGNTVDSIAINKQNQLIVVYKNKKCVVIGTISEDQTEIDESTLLYRLEKNYYTVVGALNYSVKEIEIPETHRGLPVKEIGYMAFMGCINLETVTISKNISVIERYAFYKCSKLSLVNYMGTAAEWRNVEKWEHVDNPLINASIMYNYKKQ